MRARWSRPRVGGSLVRGPASGLGLFLAALAACSPAPPQGSSPRPRGSEIYTTMGCLVCHGPGGVGSTMAPPLTGLAQHWDRAGLAAYLADPRAHLAKDARLAALKQRFGTEMPALGLPEADRLAAADYLLALEAPAGP